MAFKISDIDTQHKDCQLTYGEHVLKFKYRYLAYTPNHEDVVEEATRQGKIGAVLKAMLLPLLSWWDVEEEVPATDKEGKPLFKNGVPSMKTVSVPLTEEGLGKVPIRVLSDINKAINADASPGEASSTSSEGSFS